MEEASYRLLSSVTVPAGFTGITEGYGRVLRVLRVLRGSRPMPYIDVSRHVADDDHVHGIVKGCSGGRAWVFAHKCAANRAAMERLYGRACETVVWWNMCVEQCAQEHRKHLERC